MKILLVEPAKPPLAIGGEDVFVYEPLALEYVAGGVTPDHDVRILDLRLEKTLPEVLEEFAPDVVGITAYTVHVNSVRALFDDIKQWDPKVLTVVGGHHATILPGDFFRPSIDAVVIGEGVFTFREIVRRFERGEGLEGLPGIACRHNGRPVRTEPAPPPDLDAFPLPARALTAKYRQRYFSEWMKPLASIRTSKGCPHRCSFCALWKVAGGKYFTRQPDRIVEELAGIEEPFVFFADDESLIDAPRMKKLAARIKESGIDKRYFLYGRSDTIARNPDLLEAWRDAGLERVFVGLEFFRDEDLRYIRKRSTTDDNAKAVKILHDLGIEVYASLIVRPEFGREDFAALRRYCRELELCFASFGVLTPLPGTDFYEEVKDRLLTDDYDYVDLIHTLLPTALPLKDFYQEYARLYRKAIPLGKALSVLRKFSWKEIPSILVKTFQVQRWLKSAHLDYAGVRTQNVPADRPNLMASKVLRKRR